MTTYITKTWFDGEKVVTQEIPESEIYKQEQEPVAWMYTSHLKGDQRYITRYQTDLTTYKADKVWPLYTAPRQWVGLTDEEVVNLVDNEDWYNDPEDFVKTVEAKLKGKNT